MGKKLQVQVCAEVEVSDFLRELTSFTQDDKALIKLAEGIFDMIDDKALVVKLAKRWATVKP